MKKLIITSALLVFTIMACSQALEQTFNKIIWAKQGIKFGDNTIQTTAATGAGTVTWDAITGKPTSFPPTAHNHDLLYKPISYVPDWSEITNKPDTMNVIDAISQSQYLVIPKLTTVQITALTPQTGMFIYDLTLNVLKIYNGTEWKILITNQ